MSERRSGEYVHLQGSNHRWRLGHRPALDGIRGVAILLVLARHGGLPLQSAGSVGVALFFGLSGFLITELLLEEYERSSTISFRTFYARRARRLLPALVALVGATALAGIFLGPRFFSWHIAAAALLYVGNWVIASGKNLASLTHTWTLSVEEQFYLVWPLIVFISARRGRRAVMIVASVGIALGLAWLIRSVAIGAPWYRIYFSSEAAVMPLLAGAATAAWMGFRQTGKKSQVRYVGWGLIAVGAGMPELATVSIVPVITAIAVVLILPNAAEAESPILSVLTLRWFGERSYSIYLWNGPLAYWLREVCHWPWWGLLLAVTFTGILFGAASYRWIESPLRHRQSATGTKQKHAPMVEDNHGATVEASTTSRTVPRLQVSAAPDHSTVDLRLTDASQATRTAERPPLACSDGFWSPPQSGSPFSTWCSASQPTCAYRSLAPFDGSGGTEVSGGA